MDNLFLEDKIEYKTFDLEAVLKLRQTLIGRR